MARLLVKKTPWWVSHKKQMLVWLPVATLQASTLTGLGYVYHRLSGLEEQQVSEDMGAVAVDQSETPSKPILPLDYTLVSPQTDRLWLPRPAPVSLQVALASPQTTRMMGTGHDFSAASHLTVVPAPHKPVVKKILNKKRSVVKVALTPKPSVSVVSSITPKPRSVEEPVSFSLFQPNAGTVPVGASVWVYLGELRDYGWYGQKLHIAPDSGLPEVGKSYHTQKINGFYDAPHGNRSMGGFQQGDKVVVQQVFRESTGDVWAQLFKEVAVGRN
jgi:hypothetical protein